MLFLSLLPLLSSFDPTPILLPPGLPPSCREFALCERSRGADWQRFREEVATLLAGEGGRMRDEEAERWGRLMREYGIDAGVALECRMGVGSVFYKLARYHSSSGRTQWAHNFHQLAMSMMWDTTRQPGGMDCLKFDLWGSNWDLFMDEYLSLAFQIKRHEDEGLPPSLSPPRSFRNESWRIAIASTCAYPEGHLLHGIDQVSIRNRRPYCDLHGYGNEFFTEVEDRTRHPVWSAISAPLRLLESGKYDWVAWLDCDAMTVDMETTIDHVIMKVAGDARTGKLDPDVHFLISEDGRGLAGGNWIARNSPWTLNFLRSVLGTADERTHPYNRHDLRDQFSLLWHLIRSGADSTPPPPSSPWTWQDIGYPREVRLVPQRLLNAYPWSLCRPSHHCFEDEEDFIVSFITLGNLSRDLAFAMLNKFLQQSLESYEKAKARKYAKNIK